MKKHSFENDYYEIRALLTLQNLFENEYSSLIRSESPDLKTLDNEIGIEITRTVNEQSKKEDVFFNKQILKHNILDVDPKALDSFQKSGKRIFSIDLNGEEKVCGYSFAAWHSNELVIDTIARKMRLINKGKFQITKHIDLYVFSDSFDEYDDDDIDEIMDAAIKNQNQYEIQFRYIYFDDLYSFVMIDLSNRNYKRFDIRNIITNICEQAKSEAERA